MKLLSDNAESVLAALVDGGDGDSIDATHWADAIVELLNAGMAKLEGTLAQASLVATTAGEQYMRVLTGDAS